jgi:diaminopimelate decarboxylase
LAEKFGTPLYVYSGTAIRQRAMTLDRAFVDVPHTLCYSVKANPNLAILRLLRSLQCGFDIVSGGELERVRLADPSALPLTVFSGVGKTTAEIDAALGANILMFNVESESELQLLAARAARRKQRAPLALRVNPDVPAETHPYISTGLRQHKFGIPVGEAMRLYARASKEKHLLVVGVSVHIGSQITDMAPFATAMRRVSDLVRELTRMGHKIRYVDAGGGLGINYSGEPQASFEKQAGAYAEAILSALSALNVHVLLEPGRAIVGPTGVLVTRVLYRKRNDSKQFLVTDAAMNDLLRPSLYGAEHRILPVERRDVAQETVDVVGPVCETGDFFARERKLARIEEGDLVAVLDAGAYGMSLASNYNSRPRAAEAMVQGRHAKLIRRRERIRDLVRAEI